MPLHLFQGHHHLSKSIECRLAWFKDTVIVEKVKENFQWLKSYKDFPIYKIFSGLTLASIFITSVPEKISDHLSTQRLKYNIQNCDCTDEEKLDIIERYENKKKIQQYGG